MIPVSLGMMIGLKNMDADESIIDMAKAVYFKANQTISKRIASQN